MTKIIPRVPLPWSGNEPRALPGLLPCSLLPFIHSSSSQMSSSSLVCSPPCPAALPLSPAHSKASCHLTAPCMPSSAAASAGGGEGQERNGRNGGRKGVKKTNKRGKRGKREEAREEVGEGENRKSLVSGNLGSVLCLSPENSCPRKSAKVQHHSFASSLISHHYVICILFSSCNSTSPPHRDQSKQLFPARNSISLRWIPAMTRLECFCVRWRVRMATHRPAVPDAQ